MYMYVFLIHIHVHCTLYFILSYCYLLWLRCIGFFVLYIDSSPASRAASVAQLVRALPSKWTVVGSSSTRGSFFFEI